VSNESKREKANQEFNESEPLRSLRHDLASQVPGQIAAPLSRTVAKATDVTPEVRWQYSRTSAFPKQDGVNNPRK
jgi:hypothetical protein